MKVFLLYIISVLPFVSQLNSQTFEELNEKMNLHYNKGNYDSALHYAESGLIQCETEYGKSHEKYGTCLGDLAILYEIFGRYDEALPLYLTALNNAEINFGKSHFEYGKQLGNLASFYHTIGNYDEVEPLFLEALDIIKTSERSNDPELGFNLNNLAVHYKTMGRYEEALVLYQESLKCTELNFGKYSHDYGIGLDNLANLLREMGQYEEAFTLYSESLSILERTLGNNHFEYGIVLNNLANLYQEMGRYDEALSLYQEALKNTEITLGREHPQYGIRLNNIATLYYDMNRYEDAIPYLLESLENTKDNLGDSHFEYAINLNNLGRLYCDLGRYQEALPFYLDALKIVEKNFGKNHSQYGIYLKNLAGLYYRMEIYQEAIHVCLQALENIDNSLGKNHFDFSNSLNLLALLYMSSGNFESMVKVCCEANLSIHNQIRIMFSYSSVKEKKDFLNTFNSFFDVYQSFNLKTANRYNQLLEMLYNNQLILKALLLTSSKNTLQAVRESGGEETREIYDQWIGIKRRLAKEYSKPISERASNLDSLETEANKLEGRLVSLSKDFMTEKQKQEITWKDVRQRLRKDEIAIEFSSFRYYDKRWTDSTFYIAYVVTSETKYPEMVYLFEEKELDELLKHKSPNKLYAVRGTEKISETKTDYTGVDLYGLVIKPLEKYLEGKKRIYFSTDGILHQFSFAAFSTGEGELLCDKYELVQLNSTGELALEEGEPEREPAILVGGIAYEYKADQTSTEEKEESHTYNILEDESITESRSNRGREMEWNYLPGTETEVEKLAEIYTKNNISSNTLTGIYATEESIKKLDGNSPKVLHIATHGFFFENPERKEKDRRISSFDEKQSYIISEDPLMRSGLILAGGNYAWKNGSNPYEEEDGILTAYEISNLNLLKTDLVVLSACETGLGDIEGSEGVYGMQRAFRMAGVEKIIMSLWQVPDKETVEFMETFYTNWLSGQTIREAFNNTQKEMSKKYKEKPEKWAAFVLLE